MKKRFFAIQFLCVRLLIFSFIPAEAAAKYSGNGIRNNGIFEGITIDIYGTPYTSIAEEALAAYQPAGCTWFVSGRVKELTGKSCAINGPNYWYNTQGPANGFTSTNTMPTTHKAIICTEGSTVHVSILEYVYSDGSIIVSEGGCHLAPNNDYCNIGKYNSISNYMSTMGLTKMIGYVDLGVGFSGGTQNPDVGPTDLTNPTDPSDPDNSSNVDITHYHPYTISHLSEIEEMCRQNKGLQFSTTIIIPTETEDREPFYLFHNYRKLDVPERGYIIFKYIESCHNPISNMHYGALADMMYAGNRELHLYKSIISSDYQIYCVDKGSYYYDIAYSSLWGEDRNLSAYLYFLPMSKIMTLKQTTSSDSNTATITCQFSENGSFRVDYREGRTDANAEPGSIGGWTSIAGDRIEITKNGFYTVRAQWPDGQWPLWVISQEIEITGIGKASTGSSSDDNESDSQQQANTPQNATSTQTTPTLVDATIKASKSTVQKGKKTTVKITSTSGGKITVKGKSKNAKNKKYVKIKNNKITFQKKAPKGTYKFTVTSAAKENYTKTTKTISIKVK